MIIDKGEHWGFMRHDDPDHAYFENGDKEPLTKAHYMIDFGKYKGTTLDKIDDEWYLKYLQKSATENKDWLLDKVLNLDD